ncbi:hypothetical protein ACOMHN_035253 [Nucella lapillus]
MTGSDCQNCVTIHFQLIATGAARRWNTSTVFVYKNLTKACNLSPGHHGLDAHCHPPTVTAVAHTEAPRPLTSHLSPCLLQVTVRWPSSAIQWGHLSLHPALAAASSAAPAASKRADKPLRWQDEAQDWTIHSKGRLLAVTWADGQLSNLHSLWLRYCCHCGQCLEQHTGQRLYLCENLDPHVTLESVAREGDDLVLEFGGGVPHHGRVPLSFLREYDYSTPALLRKKAAVHVNTHAKEVPELTYEAVTQTDDGLYRWLRQLGDYGFCVLKGVPTDDPLTVLKMAEMIGPIQDTIYDDVFDVHVSDHQRTNVAYSADGLVYHQDLLYYESPPGLQFLHTLQFDACVTGGESLIVDMFKVASEFQQAHPTHFHALTSIPATFQKIHYGRYPSPLTRLLSPLTSLLLPLTSLLSPLTPLLSPLTPLLSPLTPLLSPLTPLTSDPSPLTSDPSPLTFDPSPLTSDPSPLTSDLSPLTPSFSPLTPLLSPLTPPTSTLRPPSLLPSRRSTTPHLHPSPSPLTSDLSPLTLHSTTCWC